MKSNFWCGALMLAMTVAAGAQKAKPQSQSAQPLLPVFSGTTDEPEFQATFTNDTTATVNIVQLLENSSMIFDGKEYQRGVTLFAGNSHLGSGASWSFTVELFAYVPDPSTYDQTRKIWHINHALKAGRHTVLLNYGGQQFGPVEFIWKPSSAATSQ